MANDRHFPYVRQQMIQPYPLEENTRGREYVNRVAMPHFASFFKDGQRILFVGRHPIWDYSPFFNSPQKQCEYIVIDSSEDCNPPPDFYDNVGKSQFPDEHFDGIVLIGVYDSLYKATAEEVTAGVLRMLKPDGRVFVATTAGDAGSYNPVNAWPDFVVDEVHYTWGDTHWNKKEDDGGYYGKGVCYGIFLIMRKK